MTTPPCYGADEKEARTEESPFDLNLPGDKTRMRRYAFVFSSLFVLLLVIYANSFHGDWQFDDLHNIVNNPNVHLTQLTWPQISKSFYITILSQTALERPLARFSFALNYYFGGLKLFGYHLVNFVIHYLAALFLFLFLYNTLKLPRLKARYGAIAYEIALLATAFWATSPLQVTAVTYIVQRMASLCGLGYILAMYLYLKGRTASSRRKSILLYSACILSGLIALSSKENGVLLPVSLFCFEILIMQEISKESFRKSVRIFIAPAAILLILGCAFLLTVSRLGYSTWTFSLKERLLTEPRVFFYYISLLLHPINARLALDHDILISHTWFDPWTTLPALIALTAFVAGALLLAHKRPLISFCMLFFLINHLLEGSFIPLDLVFEHRNYIPSMLFFVPPVLFMLRVVRYFSYSKLIYTMMAFGVVILLAAQGVSVYTRNTIFRDPKTFWRDNIKKTPNLSRPHAALGLRYFLGGDFTNAGIMLKKALALSRYPNLRQISVYHILLGRYYLQVEKNADQALIHFRRALTYQNSISQAYEGIAEVMLRKGLFDLAHANNQIALNIRPREPDFLNDAALIALKRGAFAEAIATGRQVLARNRALSSPLAIMAEAYHRMGEKETAILYWEKYSQKEPADISALLALVELYADAADNRRLDAVIGRLLALKGERSLSELMTVPEQARHLFAYLADQKVILPIIFKRLVQLAEAVP